MKGSLLVVQHSDREYDRYIENVITEGDDPVRGWTAPHGAIKQWCLENDIPMRDISAHWHDAPAFVVEGDEHQLFLVRMRWM